MSLKNNNINLLLDLLPYIYGGVSTPPTHTDTVSSRPRIQAVTLIGSLYSNISPAEQTYKIKIELGFANFIYLWQFFKAGKMLSIFSQKIFVLVLCVYLQSFLVLLISCKQPKKQLHLLSA